MNDATAVQWLPAVGVLCAGLLFGAVLLWRLFARSRSAAKGGGVPGVEVRDLAGRSEVLLRQLRELDDTASKRTPEQLARERYALELEAAQALLALEEKGALSPLPAAGKIASPESSAATAPAAAAPGERATLRGFLWGVGSAVGGVLLIFFVYQSAKPREQGAPVTGNAPSSAQAGAATDYEAALQAALTRNPNDVESRLELARLYVERENWMGVWNETGKILERNPENPRALAYQSLVRMAMGQMDLAVTMLKKAIGSEPDLAEAYAYLALAYVRTGHPRDADAIVAKASKRFPDRAPDFRQYLSEVKKREVPVAQASAAGPNPHASVGAPDDASNPHASVGAPGQGPEPQQSTGGGRRVAGTVDIDPGLRSSISPAAILFVFARAAGAGGGPPVAVKRLSAAFPVSFELSEADSMMGQPFPDRLSIEARLDSDGDPTTRPPTDPKARLDGVKAGSTGLRLVLRRP